MIQRLLCVFSPSKSCAHLFLCYLVPCLFKPSDLRSDGFCASYFCSLHLICFGLPDFHPVAMIISVMIKFEPSDLSDGSDLSRLIFFCVHYIFSIFTPFYLCIFFFYSNFYLLKNSIKIFSFLVMCLFFIVHFCFIFIYIFMLYF